jgi:hypothetical protein
VSARARINTALGITEQGFNSDGACQVPWVTESGEPSAQIQG